VKRFLKWFGIIFVILVVLPLLLAILLFYIYRQDISTQLVNGAKQKLGIELYVGRINLDVFGNWPHSAVQLNEVWIYGDTLGHRFALNAKSIDLSFNLRKLFQKSFEVKQIAIKEGYVQIIRTDSILRKEAASHGFSDSLQMQLRKINLKQVDFKYSYPLKGKLHEGSAKHVVVHLSFNDKGVSGQADGTWWIKGLSGNTQHGSFLTATSLSGKIGFSWFKSDKVFFIHPTKVLAGKTPVNVSAVIENGSTPQALMYFHVVEASYNRMAVLLNKRIREKLNMYSCDQPLTATSFIKLDLNGVVPPRVKVSFSAKQANVTLLKSGQKFSQCIFNGELDMRQGSPELAVLQFDSCHTFYNGHEVSATLTVKNLTNPFLKLEADVLMDAEKLAQGEAKRHKISGKIRTSLSFEAPLNSFNTKRPWAAPAKLSAEISTTKLSYYTHQGRFKYTLAGSAKFNGSILQFSQINLQSPAGALDMSGKIINLADYLDGRPVPCQVQLFAHANLLNLDPILNSPAGGKSTSKQKNSLLTVNVQLLADKFIAKGFKAEKVNAALSFIGNDVELKNLQMRSCEGTMHVNGKLKNLSLLELNIDADKINIKELFKEFNDFNQQAIVANNLSGSLNSQARIQMKLNQNFAIVPGSLKGDVDLHLLNGHLLGFPPLIDLQHAVFPHRNFHDVAFTELSERFTIGEQSVRIHELEVASDLISFFVAGGVYNFNGPSVINVLIPWSNLKKKKGEMPKLSGKSAEDARGVKINFSGLPGALKFGFGFKPLD